MYHLHRKVNLFLVLKVWEISQRAYEELAGADSIYLTHKANNKPAEEIWANLNLVKSNVTGVERLEQPHQNTSENTVQIFSVMDDVLSRSRVKNLAKLQSWINFTSLPSVLWVSHFELLIWIRVGNGEIISAPSFSLACSWSEKLFCSSKANRLTSKHQPMQTIRVESLWWQRKNLEEMAVSSLSLHLGTAVSCRGRHLVPWEAVWVVPVAQAMSEAAKLSASHVTLDPPFQLRV